MTIYEIFNNLINAIRFIGHLKWLNSRSIGIGPWNHIRVWIENGKWRNQLESWSKQATLVIDELKVRLSLSNGHSS